MTSQESQPDSFRDMLEEIRSTSREVLTRLTKLEVGLEEHDDLLFRGTNNIPGLAVRVGMVEKDIEVIKAKESKLWSELWKLIMAAIIGAGATLASQFTWNPPNKP